MVNKEKLHFYKNIRKYRGLTMGKLLFHLADATMPKEKFNFQKEDQELLLGEICINRIASIAYRNLVNDSEINISNEVLKILKIIYENNLKRSKQYCENVKYISQIMKDVDFGYALLKGAFLNTCVYEKGMRTSNDIDILIEEENVSRCQDILTQNGFIQGEFVSETEIMPATRKDIIFAKLNFGETIPFVKMQNGAPLVIDLNFSIDYKPEKETRIVKELLNNIVDVTYEEVIFKSLNIDDFIIHLCCHLYKEATVYDWVNRRKDLLLYKFSDINVVFNRYLDERRVNALINRINYLGLNKECYYAIYNTGEIFPRLYDVTNIQKILVSICPNDLTFMKQIYNPMENKLYSYRYSFIEWFELRNRIEALELIERE
ncbi:MAG: nucleotidyltransferase family protein [Lachnoclostridium sp.]|nr:nucleotidyltransferase family protein [Lachnospira sp.]MCM1248920.1 nucleotidyltransferase family protein [Lachnoclostridium sp.]